MIFTRSLLLMILIPVTGICQFVGNGSFEGPPQQGVPPAGWTACNLYSTPDTEPGFWGINLPASNGATYVSLFTRGIGGYINDNTKEGMGTSLLSPLEKLKCYSLSIDLAFFPKATFIDPWGPTVVYENPVRLNIWGGSSSCDKRFLLHQTQAVSNEQWIKYDFSVTPPETVTYIILEAEFNTPGATFGNVQLDNLVIQHHSFDLGPDKVACEGEFVTLTAGIDGASVQWSTGSDQQSIQVNEPGTYHAAITKHGCRLSDEINVVFQQPVTVDLGNDRLMCLGDTIQISADVQPNAHYRWDDGATGHGRIFHAPGSYVLNVSNGCFEAEDEIVISVKDSLCCPPLIAPNVFTPNNDGKNDFFKIVGSIENYPEFDMKIFNRWGKLVFSSSQITESWSGQMRTGGTAESGIYFWTARTRCMNRGVQLREEQLRGVVHLME